MAAPVRTGLLSKARNLMRIVRDNGGIRGTLYNLWRVDEIKDGTLIGSDKFGNKYYENPRYMYARDRWVIYNEDTFFDYDGSQVPPEWHRWLHHMTDDPPSLKPLSQHRWQIDHEESVSNTTDRYFPYSTTRTKIHAWTPPSSSSRSSGQS